MKVVPQFSDNTFNSPEIVTETNPMGPVPNLINDKIRPMPNDFVIYKYGEKKYMDEFLILGRTSFAIADIYKDALLTPGQQDDEVRRVFTPNAENHDLFVGANLQRHVTGMKIEYKLKGRDADDLKYYMWCSSLVHDPVLLFPEFKADCCVKINDTKKFFRRLELTCRNLHPTTAVGHGCDILGRVVTYYRESTMPPSDVQLDLIFIKGADKSYQQEFKIIFLIDPKKCIDSRISFDIGNIEDIAEFV